MGNSGNLREIGARIQRLREERGSTQSAFARKIGTTQSALSRIEAGEQNVSANLLEKIGAALGRSVIAISGETINLEIR
ncbi:MAG: UDP-N-acetylglucosamine 1-carboxyvinyltransferase, partial [Parcubacteria group bacterium Gr01-1014_72]